MSAAPFQSSERMVLVVMASALGCLLLAVLMGAFQTPGLKSVVWRGVDERGARVASGVYVCRIRAGEFVAAQKLTLLK